MSYTIPFDDKYLGQRVRLGETVSRYVVLNDGQVMKEGTVCYIHPQQRFYMVEYIGKGGKYRQCYHYWKERK